MFRSNRLKNDGRLSRGSFQKSKESAGYRRNRLENKIPLSTKSRGAEGGGPIRARFLFRSSTFSECLIASFRLSCLMMISTRLQPHLLIHQDFQCNQQILTRTLRPRSDATHLRPAEIRTALCAQDPVRIPSVVIAAARTALSVALFPLRVLSKPTRCNFQSGTGDSDCTRATM